MSAACSGSKQEVRQETETGSRAMKLLEKDLLGEAPGGTFPEERVPVWLLRGEGERGDGLSSTQAPLSRLKKDPEHPQKEAST